MTTSQKATAELPAVRHALMPSHHDGKTYTTPSLAKQSFKDECDINHIMSQYLEQGVLTHSQQNAGEYADLGDADDYHSAMNLVTQAQQSFASMSASIRERFNNDPSKFLDFVSDENNLEEMRLMGLISPDSADEDDPVAVSADPSSTPSEPPETAAEGDTKSDA